MVRAFLSIGSNLGNRYQTIIRALRELRAFSRVLRTSFLYQTMPMYVLDQPKFLNLACEIETSESPSGLLSKLKGVEALLGRQKTLRNGPRTIDLDILFYSDCSLSIARVEEFGGLVIPHPRLQERDFVIVPMCDIAPMFVHPVTQKTIRQLLDSLPSSSVEKVIGLPSGRVLPLSSKTYVMGILNCTPDSFSDGGWYNDVDKALQHAEELIQNGVDMLDVGGESTRPGAPAVSAAEEISRVVPIVKELRKRWPEISISVDTVKASVARACCEEGADMINDVSAGVQDPQMLTTIESLGVPLVVMHMRGTPRTMNDLNNYDDVVVDTARELKERLAACRSACIPDFNLIVDPGLGFAKSASQNCELLRRLPDFQHELEGFPVLVGPSRKRFVGLYSGVTDPSQRFLGTVACVCSSIAGGASIVRVHDVKGMTEAVMMSDAIYRPTSRSL